MKNIGQVFQLISVFFIALLITTGCGGGEGASDQPAQNETSNDNGKILISGTLSDTPVNLKPGLTKLRQGSRPVYMRAVGTWANAVIQAIDSFGVVIATVNSDAAGNYLLTVPPGTHYFLKASLGNLVLKTFIETATADLSNTVIDPATSATVKILSQAIGAPGAGEPGADVSSAFTMLYTPSTLPAINSNAKLPQLITAITEEIATNYDPLALAPAVGSGGTAGTSLVTEIAGDITPPIITVTGPLNGATGVGLSTTVTATLSEQMADLSITAGTFIVRAGTEKITGEITYALNTATFTPSVGLLSGTTYTATIKSSVTDLAGNKLGVDYSWSFTTVADLTPPVISLETPANSSTGVDVNATVTGTFSEEMTGSDFTTANFTVNDGTNNITGTVKYAGLTATFTPGSDLKYNTLYTVTISGVVKDIANNPLGANYSWTFTTTPDVSPPAVSETAPVNNLTGVTINSAVTATFSEAMIAGNFITSTFTISNGTINIPGSVNYSGTTATFSPTGNLNFDTDYTATISGAVTDLAGNSLGADYVWIFTTGANPDSTAPTVLASGKLPADLAVDIPVDSTISATFSEAMTADNFTAATFTVSDGIADIAGTVTYSGVTATFNPSADLSINTTYTVTVSAAVTDLASNPLGVNELWSFTTNDPGPLVSALIFPDINLKNCVINTGETYALNIKVLNCSGKNITDLTGIGSLTSLTHLYLNNNQQATTTLPAEIGNLTALTVLELRNTALASLPAEVSALTALTDLVLNNNQLVSIPLEIGSLTALTKLYLNDNLITDDLLLDLGNLTALTYLALNNNQLINLPTGIVNISGLTELYLNNNDLTSLPVNIGNLTALGSIGLIGNQLSTLPASIGNLTGLTSLDLRGNQLTSLPANIGNLTGLTSLDLRGNQLTSLPTTIGNLTALRSIGLSDNMLLTIPTEIGSLTGLTSLDLSNNQLAGLPAGIGSLTGLTSLILKNNALLVTGLPAEISNLTAVTSLSLQFNQLTSLPAAIGSLTALTSLDLRNNVLTSLPAAIGSLAALTSLDLQNNQLPGLPVAIGGLANLTGLVLNDNLLTSLPIEIGNLPKLTFLNLAGNMLAGIPLELGNLSTLTTLNLLNNINIPCADITNVVNLLGDVVIQPTICVP